MIDSDSDTETMVANAVIARSITGQMPTMAVFNETQQASAAEKQSELAWREAQLTVTQRHRRTPISRLPIVIAVFIVAGVIAATFLLRRGGSDAATLSTPASDLAWRSVVIESGSTVEMPGVAVVGVVASDIGQGTRITTTVPGATIAVSLYHADYGMRGAGAVAVDVLAARAADLGDANAGGQVRQNRDRWGDAYDLTVITDQPIARLRVTVIGSKLFVIEVDGAPTTRTNDIFSHVINTLAPKT